MQARSLEGAVDKDTRSIVDVYQQAVGAGAKPEAGDLDRGGDGHAALPRPPQNVFCNSKSKKLYGAS
jgi:hypothetical protein